MSEERFDRLESQLAQVIDGMGMMQANMTTMQANMTTMQANMTTMQANMTTMQNRIDSIEGTLLIAMRSGFESLQTAIDDIDYDLNISEVQTERNARLNRKLHQRVTAIEARLDDRR
jgi:FtsZ-binding cell division protein ZapB